MHDANFEFDQGKDVNLDKVSPINTANGANTTKPGELPTQGAPNRKLPFSQISPDHKT
jgi:hypothetical protein